MNWERLDVLKECDAIVLCQPHNEFLALGAQKLSKKIIASGVFIDVPGSFAHSKELSKDILYWTL